MANLIETAKQQIMLYLHENRRTPTTLLPSLTQIARPCPINFNTVSLCSLSASSVSNPGKFQLTRFTNSIQESISCSVPSTTVSIFSLPFVSDFFLFFLFVGMLLPPKKLKCLTHISLV